MKKLLPVLFLFLFVACDSSDDEDKVVAPVDSDAVCLLTNIKSSKWKTDERFHYDAEGNVQKYELVGGGTIFETHTFEYDSNNRLIKATRLKNQTGLINSNSNYTYNSEGQLISEVRETLKGGVYIVDLTAKYEYNASGELIKVTTLSPYLNSYITYEYQNGSPQTIRSYRMNGELFRFTELKFDDKNYYGSGSPNLSPIIFSTLKHNIVQATVKDGNGQLDDEVSFTASYTYNDKGFPTEGKFTYADGDIDNITYQYQCD